MQGEVWDVECMPQRGAEIGKVRPAIVVSSAYAGKLPLRIVVPITDWKPDYGQCFWFTQILPTAANGLVKLSGADAFQVKSVCTERLVKHIGTVNATELERVIDAVTICLETL
jgi:mRNA interferase MazF